MQCQAITKKGTQCKNPAVYPEGNPVCCRIAAHIEATNATPNITTNTSTKIPTKVPTSATRATTNIPTNVPTNIPTNTPTIAPTISSTNVSANIAKIVDFIDYKAEVVSIINSLYEKGLSNTKDQALAIAYIKRNFPKDVYQRVKKRLSEGITLLEDIQNALIKTIKKQSNNEKVVMTLDYYRMQTDKTHRLLNTLINVFEKGDGGGSILNILKEYDTERIEKEELLSVLPDAPISNPISTTTKYKEKQKVMK